MQTSQVCCKKNRAPRTIFAWPSVRPLGFAFVLFDQFHDLAELLSDIVVVFAFMRYQTGRTVLHAVFEDLVIAAAVFTQRVKRAVAEQAVEIFLIRGFMTGKEFTRRVLKKFVI